MSRNAVIAAVVLSALPWAGAEAGRFSWFDNGATGTLSGTRPAFSLDLYQSQKDRVYGDYATTAESDEPEDGVRLYGGLGAERASPETPKTAPAFAADALERRQNLLGVTWQHRVNARDRFAVSAEFGESALTNLSAPTASSPDAVDTRAVFSWTTQWDVARRPSITGSVYLGGESARDESYRHLGRRYFGLAVGGQLTLYQAHTPYVSFRMQRSAYGAAEEPALATQLRAEDQSQVAAGWRWQVQRDFSLQAEASYGLGGPGLQSVLNPERDSARVLFGTRFDFR